MMRRLRTTMLAAVCGALVAFVLLMPSGGIDTDPPECYAYFNYVVPCGLGPQQSQGAGFAGAGAVIAAGLVAIGAAAGRRDRNRR